MPRRVLGWWWRGGVTGVDITRHTTVCRTQSRRDDLEALGYVLVYLMTGSLPWQKISTLKLKANLTRIKILKLKHKPEMLCKVIFDKLNFS